MSHRVSAGYGPPVNNGCGRCVSSMSHQAHALQREGSGCIGASRTARTLECNYGIGEQGKVRPNALALLGRPGFNANDDRIQVNAACCRACCIELRGNHQFDPGRAQKQLRSAEVSQALGYYENSWDGGVHGYLSRNAICSPVQQRRAPVRILLTMETCPSDLLCWRLVTSAWDRKTQSVPSSSRSCCASGRLPDRYVLEIGCHKHFRHAGAGREICRDRDHIPKMKPEEKCPYRTKGVVVMLAGLW